MKKWFCAMFAILLIFLLCSCSLSDERVQTEKTSFLSASWTSRSIPLLLRSTNPLTAIFWSIPQRVRTMKHFGAS